MVPQSFLLFSTFWNIVISKPTMVIVYATVGSSQLVPPDCQTNSNIQWKDCVLWCASSPYCLLTVKTQTGCIWCGYGAITSATTVSSSSGQELAYKIETDGETCSAPGAPSSGVLNNYNYTVGLNVGVYKFTYQEPKSCPTGYQYFKRTNCEWCMQVFYSSILLDNYQAVSYCAANGAQLSAIDSEDERKYIWSSALIKFKYSFTVNNFIWVDGYRKPTCTTADWKTKIGCGQNFSSFEDKYDTCAYNNGGYDFTSNNPDGAVGNGVMQGCIGMYVVTVKDQNGVNGLVDDQFCSFIRNTDNSVRANGYVCGRLAT